MRRIVNMSKEDRGPSHGHRQHAQKFGKDGACGSGDVLANRQTDTQTDILITILRNRSCGRSKNIAYLSVCSTSCDINSVSLYTPFTRYKRVSNRLYNRLGEPVVQPVGQPAASCKQTPNVLSNRLYNLFDNRLDVCIRYTPVVQLVWQQVVSCKRGFRVRVVMDSLQHEAYNEIHTFNDV